MNEPRHLFKLVRIHENTHTENGPRFWPKELFAFGYEQHDRLIQQTARVEAEHRKSPCETSATSLTPLILGLKSDAGAIRKRLVGWSVATVVPFGKLGPKVDWKSLLEHVFQFEMFE